MHWEQKSESYKSVSLFFPLLSLGFDRVHKVSAAAHRAQKKQHTKPSHTVHSCSWHPESATPKLCHLYSLFLAEEEQKKLRLCQGYMSWFCSPCMASQLLRSCRHRRRICVSLTAQGFSWSIRSRRSPTNCQGIHSVTHLGTGYLWPKYHPGRLLITQKLEKMEHIWAQQTLPHDAYMLTDWAISHLKLPELQSLFLTVIQRIYSGNAS